MELHSAKVWGNRRERSTGTRGEPSSMVPGRQWVPLVPRVQCLVLCNFLGSPAHLFSGCKKDQLLLKACVTACSTRVDCFIAFTSKKFSRNVSCFAFRAPCCCADRNLAFFVRIIKGIYDPTSSDLFNPAQESILRILSHPLCCLYFLVVGQYNSRMQ